MNDLIASASTIVIKIGSVLLQDPADKSIRTDWFTALAKDIKQLKDSGKQIILVSSGGVALGRKDLGISYDTPPAKIPLALKQAASAVGQFYMYNAYHSALQSQGIHAAQVLLTLSETENRRMYLNARATLETLLDKGIVPIINENDSITTEEIRFGDNDRLAVRVGQMTMADCVILLSTIDGLYTANPHDDPTARHIPEIHTIDQTHIDMAAEAKPGLSTGGMKSKLQAAISAVQSGMSLIITDGQDSHALQALTAPETDKRYTVFHPQAQQKQNARKSWISTHLNPSGSATIDDGAAKALQNGKSLLLVGITDIQGQFQRGDVITVHTRSGEKIATGISAYNADDARKVMGQNSHDMLEKLGYTGRSELIHRNDLSLHSAS